MTTDLSTVKTDRARLKTGFVRALLGSLAGTGLVGIGALILGEFGELEGRILTSTLLVGLYSLLCLAALVAIGRPHAPVGLAGIAASSIALALGVSLTWWVNEDFFDDGDGFVVLKAFGVFAVLGFALAHAALVWSAAENGPAITRTVAAGTSVALAVVAAMLCWPVITESTGGGAYWRMLGVFAIIDVIGTVAVPLTARLHPPR